MISALNHSGRDYRTPTYTVVSLEGLTPRMVNVQQRTASGSVAVLRNSTRIQGDERMTVGVRSKATQATAEASPKTMNRQVAFEAVLHDTASSFVSHSFSVYGW